MQQCVAVVVIRVVIRDVSIVLYQIKRHTVWVKCWCWCGLKGGEGKELLTPFNSFVLFCSVRSLLFHFISFCFTSFCSVRWIDYPYQSIDQSISIPLRSIQLNQIISKLFASTSAVSEITQLLCSHVFLLFFRPIHHFFYPTLLAVSTFISSFSSFFH